MAPKWCLSLDFDQFFDNKQYDYKHLHQQRSPIEKFMIATYKRSVVWDWYLLELKIEESFNIQLQLTPIPDDASFISHNPRLF